MITRKLWKIEIEYDATLRWWQRTYGIELSDLPTSVVLWVYAVLIALYIVIVVLGYSVIVHETSGARMWVGIFLWTLFLVHKWVEAIKEHYDE